MPVRFADVDHAGIVYYPVFYHYFHLAFEEFFRQRMGQHAYVRLLDEERIGFPAVSSECDFKSPLRFGDTVEVELSLGRLGKKSITFHYRAFRISDDEASVETESGPQLSAEGKVICVVTDLDAFRAVEVPEKLRELFLALR
jgi:4-hydroxybenzoyl-CoA thioesterase